MKRKTRLIFNTASIIFLLTLIILYGYRLVHYYMLEHKTYENKTTYLYEKLIDSKGIEGTDKGLLTKDNYYIYASKSDDNYVYYLGKLWRIISIDKNNNIKMITDDIQTLLTWENDKNFVDSNINNWLNKTENDNSGIFESSLKNETSKLMKQDNLYSGLLTKEEYELLNKNNYLVINKPFWIIGENNEKNYIDTKGNIVNDSEESDFIGVRPTIVLSKETLYISGNGKYDNPYIIINNIPEKITDSFVGEYINYSGYKWRIIETNEDKIKVALEETINVEVSFSDKNNKLSNLSGIGKYLNSEFYEKLENKDYIIPSVYYIGEYVSNNEYNYLNTYSSSVELNVGTYRLGEMFIQDYPSIYTITPYTQTNNTIYVINDNNKVYADFISSNYNVRPTIYLATDLFIIGGKGTKEEPYEVGR